MSNIVKKIRVKQEDGNFSDYIPIGANAENISFQHNGNNVENTLKKKPYYFNNVEEMKADNTLKEGDMVITLGYYEPNDGGGAEYKVINDNSLEDDGGSIIALNNGLKAQLNIRNNQVNIKQFGAYGDNEHDDTAYFQKIINSTIENIIIPEGIFLIKKINIYNKNSLKLEGLNRETCILKFNITDPLIELPNEGDAMFTDFAEVDYEERDKVEILNLKIDGNLDNYYNKDISLNSMNALQLFNRNNLIIKNCLFENFCQDPILTYGITNVIIEHSTFKNITYLMNGTINGFTLKSSFYNRLSKATAHKFCKFAEIKYNKFIDIHDECCRIDNFNIIEFINNECNNIGQYILETDITLSEKNSIIKFNNNNCNLIGQNCLNIDMSRVGKYPDYETNLSINTEFCHNVVNNLGYSNFTDRSTLKTGLIYFNDNRTLNNKSLLNISNNYIKCYEDIPIDKLNLDLSIPIYISNTDAIIENNEFIIKNNPSSDFISYQALVNIKNSNKMIFKNNFTEIQNTSFNSYNELDNIICIIYEKNISNITGRNIRAKTLKDVFIKDNIFTSENVYEIFELTGDDALDNLFFKDNVINSDRPVYGSATNKVINNAFFTNNITNKSITNWKGNMIINTIYTVDNITS